MGKSQEPMLTEVFNFHASWNLSNMLTRYHTANVRKWLGRLAVCLDLQVAWNKRSVFVC
jgi:hypothetical protein